MLFPNAVAPHNVIPNTLNNESILVEKYIKSSPPSVQMYYFIKKYSKLYNVPLKMVYKIATLETNYKNPLNFKYNPSQISYANAYGPMQLLLSTAKSVAKDTSITIQQLLTNVELNVKTSVCYMMELYLEYHDWAKVAAHYNSGSSKMNDYAMEIKNLDL